jgi:hypothetical protein
MAFLYQHVPTQIMMSAHPQTLYELADSPIALAAWMIDHDVASYGYIVKLFVDSEPCPIRHLGSGCRERFPRGGLSGSAELDRALVSQAHPFQRGPQGRPLCGVGTAEDLLGRTARRIQIAAHAAGGQGRIDWIRCIPRAIALLDVRFLPGVREARFRAAIVLAASHRRAA